VWLSEWVSTGSHWLAKHLLGGWVREWGGQCVYFLSPPRPTFGWAQNQTSVHSSLFLQSDCSVSSQWYGSLSKAKIRTWISSVGLIIFDQTNKVLWFHTWFIISATTTRVCNAMGQNDFSSCNDYDSNCGPQIN